MSSFGAGLLIGAALIVIIPEGVELLMEEGVCVRERGEDGDLESAWYSLRYSKVCFCRHQRWHCVSLIEIKASLDTV